MAGSEDVFGQKDDDSDLYDDIIVSNVELKYTAEQKQHNGDLERENNELKLRIQTLEQEVVATKKTNLTLRRNITLLFKTAKLEIAGKSNLLKDLQERYDGLVFRRFNRAAGQADIHFPKNAESPTQVQNTAFSASCLTNSRPSQASRNQQPETYSRHHNRSRQIHQESSPGLGVKICSAVQSPAPTAHVSNTNCGNNVSCSVNKDIKDSNISGSNNLLDNEKAKEHLDVQLNGDVLNSISIDFLKEVTKLCEGSSPQNSKKPSHSSNKRLTDAERVLAHHRRTAKVSIVQNAVRHFPQQTRSTFVNDNSKKYQMKSSSTSNQNYVKRFSQNAINHRGAVNHKRQNKDIHHRPIRNSDRDVSSRRSLFAVHKRDIKEGNSTKGNIKNVSDVDLLNLKTTAEKSDVLQVNNDIEQNVEAHDTTSVKRSCTDENHSFKEDMPNDCLTDIKADDNLVTNCETKSYKPRNETICLGTDNKQNSDSDKRNEKRNWSNTANNANNERNSVESSFLPKSNDGAANRSLSKDKEKSLTKQSESKHSEGSHHKMPHSRARRDEPTSRNHIKPRLTSCDRSSRRQSIPSDKHKRSSELPRGNSCNVKRRHDDLDNNKLRSHHHDKRERCERSSSSLMPDKTTRIGDERKNTISSTSNSGKLQSSSSLSDKTTRNDDERKNTISYTSNSGERQSSSSMSDKTTRNGDERKNTISYTSNSGKRQSSVLMSDKTTRNSNERENKMSSVSNSGKLQTRTKTKDSCNGQITKPEGSHVRRSLSSPRTRDSGRQASSEKRKFVESASSPKNANDSKKARLKSPHKSTNNGALPTDKYSPCKSGVLHHKIAEPTSIDNNLEEGELPD